MSSALSRSFLYSKVHTPAPLPHSTRHYHQLSQALTTLSETHRRSHGTLLATLFTDFVSTLQGKLAPIFIARFLTAAAESLAAGHGDQDAAQTLLADWLAEHGGAVDGQTPEPEVEEDMTGEDEPAAATPAAASAADDADATSSKKPEVTQPQLLVSATATRLQIMAAGPNPPQLRAMRAQLDVLAAMPEPHARVADAVYQCAAAYFAAAGPAHLYLGAALARLSYLDMDELPSSEAAEMAQSVAIAALISTEVWDLGVLGTHSIMGALEGTSIAWLGELLTQVQAGDISGFNATMRARSVDLGRMPALAGSAETLKEKVAILAVMQALSERTPANRTVTFSELASIADIPVPAVEWMAMRAMSLGLLRGKLDAVDQTLHATWVKPRTLTLKEVHVLADQMNTWLAKVDAAQSRVHMGSRDMLA